MKSEAKAVISQSWIEPTRQVVPDPSDRCKVWEYVFAYQMQCVYGIENDLSKPEGAGANAVAYILPQIDKMAEKYKEKSKNLAKNLAKANEAKAAKRGNPYPGESVCTESVCEGTRPDTPTNPSAPAHTCTDIECRCNADAENKNKSNQIKDNIIFIPISPFQADELEKDGFLLGLDILDKGREVDSSELLRIWGVAKRKKADGTLRKSVRDYVAGCFTKDLPDYKQGHALANMIRAVGLRSWPCLECYGIEVKNETCFITCSAKCARSIEAEADVTKLRNYMQSIGVSNITYNVPRQQTTPEMKKIDAAIAVGGSVDLGF